MYMFDIETLDTESTAVVLSAAIVFFEQGDDYETLLNKSLFVKFNSKIQTAKYGRTISKETLEWWANIHPSIRKTSFDPSPDDLSPEDAINALKKYIAKYGDALIWARGSLDQMVIDSLTLKLGMDRILPYNKWRDVRTGVECLCSTANNGYCEIDHPTFAKHNVIKHDPVHDCAYDAMMLLYGK